MFKIKCFRLAGLLLLSFAYSQGFATGIWFYQAAAGDWNSSSTWSTTAVYQTSSGRSGYTAEPGSTVPGSGDYVQLNPLIGTVTVAANSTINIDKLYIGNSSTYQTTASGKPTEINYASQTYVALSLGSGATINASYIGVLLQLGTANTNTSGAVAANPVIEVDGPAATINLVNLGAIQLLDVELTNTFVAINSTFILNVGTVNLGSDPIDCYAYQGGTANYSQAIKLMNGNITSSGSFNTKTVTNSTSSLIVDTAATLNIGSSTFLNPGTGGKNIITFNPLSTVNYNGADQTVYSSQSANITGGVSYGNIKFSGTGKKVVDAGTLNVSGSFTNSLANNATNYIDLKTNSTTVNLNGSSAQTLAIGAGNGITFNNLTLANAGSIITATGTGAININGNFTNSMANDTSNYVDLTTSATTLTFGGAAQTLDFGTGNGTTLNKAVFSGTGIKTVKNTLAVNGNFTNSLANNAGNYIDLTTNATTLTFGGAAQTLDFGTGNGTTLNNAVFSGTGIKTVKNTLAVNGDFTNSLANDAGNYIDLTTNATTLTFGGAAQTLDFGTGNGTTLKNAVFSGTGIKTVKNTLAVSGNFTNSLANDASNYIDLTTNATTVTFSGSLAQTLASGSGGNPVKFYNVSFGGAGAKTLSGTAGFSVSGKGVLTMQSGSGALAAGGLLTLLSDTTGTASVAAIPTGTSITGNVNVQRYITGSTSGVNYRGYRLLSSPVNAATVNSNNVYSINYTKSGTFLTGIGGSANGFDQAGNPTLYLYREDQAHSNASFTGGNWWGISNISNGTTTYSYYLNGGSTGYNIPVGNGYLLFFRGSRSTSSPYTPATKAQAATLSTAGTLNSGNITVRNWYTPASAALGYTSTTGNGTVRGLNLVGNPYACTIDWNTSTTGGISLTNISNTISTLNVNGTYGTYQWDGTTGTALNNGSRYIASGQGFFVKATGTGSGLTFTEAAKVTGTGYNPVNTGSTAGTILSAVKLPDSHLRLNLVMDTLNSEETYIGFKAGSSPAMVENEDALYLSGPSKVHLSTLSADQIDLAINRQPLPGKVAQIIPVDLTVSSSGNYSLNRTELIGLPKLYNIWLRDAYAKDSLDLRTNASYPFVVNLADTNTYGRQR
ncbi:MAG: beta strand repeat-containing protein, partial [Mucilaginibacter sp.]